MEAEDVDFKVYTNGTRLVVSAEIRVSVYCIQLVRLATGTFKISVCEEIFMFS